MGEGFTLISLFVFEGVEEAFYFFLPDLFHQDHPFRDLVVVGEIERVLTEKAGGVGQQGVRSGRGEGEGLEGGPFGNAELFEGLLVGSVVL
jgi:hypothetical protein